MISELRIGYQVYKLEGHEDLGDICGDTDCDRAVIRYTTTEEPHRMANTILHEVLHAVWEQMGLNALMNDEIQEQVCTSLANGLSQVYFQNPDLKFDLGDGPV
jgi:hypothetical protein